jgi:hypothetical protein
MINLTSTLSLLQIPPRKPSKSNAIFYFKSTLSPSQIPPSQTLPKRSKRKDNYMLNFLKTYYILLISNAIVAGIVLILCMVVKPDWGIATIIETYGVYYALLLLMNWASGRFKKE